MDEDECCHDNAADDPDDELAARIADAVLDLARVPGRHRLAAMQMAGLADDPPSHADIARAYHLSKRRVRTLEQHAFALIAWNHPELRDEIRAEFHGNQPGRHAIY